MADFITSHRTDPGFARDSLSIIAFALMIPASLQNY